jgi:trimeric autotransporter adhesin
MFGFKPRQFTDSSMPLPRIPLIEPLEDRQFLSASAHDLHPTALHAATTHKAEHAAKTHTKTTKADKGSKKKKDDSAASSTSGDPSGSGDPGMPNIPVGLLGGKIENTITFSQAPSAVQTGLTSLASTDSLAAPTSDQTVYLGNSNGVETYTLHFTGTGTSTSIAVDENGNPVTKPTESTTTFADLTSSDAAAASEISAIAAALNLTAPTDSTTVNVSTTSAGAATYSVHLAPTSSTLTSTTSTVSSINPGGPAIFAGGGEISVDASGNPVGNQRLPFGVLPSGIQSAINANVPTGATALASSSTQIVDVQTIDGVTLYTTTFSYSGTTTTVTVNASGTPVSLPSQTTAEFSTIPQAAQTELQALATADSITTAISSTQTVTVYTEANGAVIYAVTLSNSSSTSSTSSTSAYGNWSDTITIAVDAAGNPTVPPLGRPGHGFGGGGGWGGGGGGGGPVPVAFA